MNIPVLVLLGFAAWTLIILSVGVGGYRWARITFRARLGRRWRADAPEGADWYQREGCRRTRLPLMRNCLERRTFK